MRLVLAPPKSKEQEYSFEIVFCSHFWELVTNFNQNLYFNGSAFPDRQFFIRQLQSQKVLKVH
jgi:hypothetical protein